MRKIMCWVLLLALMTAGCASGEEAAGGVWMYAASVGKADAILLGAGDEVCLIDTGYDHSRGKILAAMRQMNVTRLDAVFITHLDKDHVGGLQWLSESDIEVGAWYAPAMYIGIKSEDKHPGVKAAGVRGEEVRWLRAGDCVPFGGSVLDVLAPSVLNEDKDDNNSLVMMLRSPEGNILLTGDMEFEEEEVLLSTGADLKCDVLKVGNHGDDDTTSEALVQAASPRLAVISTDSAEKPDTPDPRILFSLQGVGAQTVVTQECTGGILVRLNGGVPSVERINLPEANLAVQIESLTPGEDVVELVNVGAQTANLSDWYIVSDRGGEMFIFPEGTQILPGGRLFIGSRSSDESHDLLWDDKKVIHKSKEDVLTLYDANGMAVSQKISNP